MLSYDFKFANVWLNANIKNSTETNVLVHLFILFNEWFSSAKNRWKFKLGKKQRKEANAYLRT